MDEFKSRSSSGIPNDGSEHREEADKTDEQQERVTPGHSCVKSSHMLLHRAEDVISADSVGVRETFPPLLENKSLQKDAISTKVNKLKNEGYVKVSLFSNESRPSANNREEMFKIHKISNPVKKFTSSKKNFKVKGVAKNINDRRLLENDNSEKGGSLDKRSQSLPDSSSYFSLNPSEYRTSDKLTKFNSPKDIIFQRSSESTTVLPRLANLTPGKCKSHTANPFPDKRPVYASLAAPIGSLQRDHIREPNSVCKALIYPNSCQITSKICYPRHSQSLEGQGSDAIPRTKLSGWNLCYPITDNSLNGRGSVFASPVVQPESTNWRELLRNDSAVHAGIFKSIQQVGTSSSVTSDQTGRATSSIFSSDRECDQYSNQTGRITANDILQTQYTAYSECSTSYKSSHQKRNRPCSTNDFHNYNDSQISMNSDLSQRQYVLKNSVNSSASASLNCERNDKTTFSETMEESMPVNRSNYISGYTVCSMPSSDTNEGFTSQNYLRVASASLNPMHGRLFPGSMSQEITDHAFDLERQKQFTQSAFGMSAINMMSPASEIKVEAEVKSPQTTDASTIHARSSIVCQSDKEVPSKDTDISNPNAKPVVAWVHGHNAFIVHLPRCEPSSEESLTDNERHVQIENTDSSTTQESGISNEDDVNKMSTDINKNNDVQLHHQEKPNDVKLSNLPSIFPDSLESTEKQLPTKQSKSKSREPYVFQSKGILMPEGTSTEHAKHNVFLSATANTGSCNKVMTKTKVDEPFHTSYRLSKTGSTYKVQASCYNINTPDSESNKGFESDTSRAKSGRKADNEITIDVPDEEAQTPLAENTVIKGAIQQNSITAKSHLSTGNSNEYVLLNNASKVNAKQPVQYDLTKLPITQHHVALAATTGPTYVMSSKPTTAAATTSGSIKNTNKLGPGNHSLGHKYIVNTSDRYIVNKVQVNTFSANAGNTYLVNPVPITLSVDGTNNHTVTRAQSASTYINNNGSPSSSLTPTNKTTFSTGQHSIVANRNILNISTSTGENIYVNSNLGMTEFTSATQWRTNVNVDAASIVDLQSRENNIKPVPGTATVQSNTDKNQIRPVPLNEQHAGSNENIRPDTTTVVYEKTDKPCANDSRAETGKWEIPSSSIEPTNAKTIEATNQTQSSPFGNKNVVANVQTGFREALINSKPCNQYLQTPSVNQKAESNESVQGRPPDATLSRATANNNTLQQPFLPTDILRNTKSRKITQIKVVIPSMFSSLKQSKLQRSTKSKQADPRSLNKAVTSAKLDSSTLSNQTDHKINAEERRSPSKTNSKVPAILRHLGLQKVTREVQEAVADCEKESHKFKFKRYAVCVSVHLSTVATDHAYSAITIITDPNSFLFKNITQQTDLIVYIVYDTQKTVMIRSVTSKYPLNPGLYTIEHTSIVKQLNGVVFEGAILKPLPNTDTIINKLNQPLVAIGNIRIKWSDACTDLVNQMSTPNAKQAIERVLAETNVYACRSSDFLKAMSGLDSCPVDTPTHQRDIKRRREALDCRCLECRKLGTFIEYKISKMLKTKRSESRCQSNRIRRSHAGGRLQNQNRDKTIRSRSVGGFASSHHTLYSSRKRVPFLRTIKNGPGIAGTSNGNESGRNFSKKWRFNGEFRKSARRLIINKKYCNDCDDRCQRHNTNLTGLNQNSNNMHNFRSSDRRRLRTRKRQRSEN